MRAKGSNYTATKRHFGELFERYSFPIFCINFTKMKNQRECLVADEYQYAVKDVINNELPRSLRIKYLHFDMKIRKKQPDFPGSLVEYAK